MQGSFWAVQVVTKREDVDKFYANLNLEYKTKEQIIREFEDVFLRTEDEH